MSEEGARDRVRVLASAALLGAALFAVLFLPDLLRGRLFAYRDAGQYHLPVSRLISSELRAGRLPFWNSEIACGMPLGANPNNYAYYPTRLLDLVLSPATALSIHFLGHWIAGGVAFAMLASTLGASLFASLVAAAVFLLAGPTLSLLNFANLAPYALWVPVSAVGTLQLARKPGRRQVAFFAICLAVQSTFAEPVFLLVEVLFLAAVCLGDPESMRGSSSAKIRAFGGAVVLAGVVSAFVWIPTLEIVSMSARESDAGATLGSSLSPDALLQIPVPQLTGDYHTLEKRTFWGEIFNAGRGPFFLSISLGIVPLLLAVVAALAATRRSVALVAVAALGILLAMGPYFPPFAALTHVGLARWFRWPVKFTWLAGLAVPLLAAFGVDALRRSLSGSRRASILLVSGLVVVGGVWLVFQFSDPSAPGALAREWLQPLRASKDVPTIFTQVHDRFLRGTIIAAVATAIIGAATVSSTVRTNAAFGAVWVVLVLGELVAPQRGVDRGIPRDVLELDTPVLEEAREVASHDQRVYFPTAHWSLLLPRAPDMPDEWWPRVILDREQGNFYHPIGERIPMVLVNPDRLVSAGAAERGRVADLMSFGQQQQLLRLLAVGATVRVGHAALDTGAPLHATVGGWPVGLVRDPDAPKVVRWMKSVAEPTNARAWSGPFLDAWTEHLARNAREGVLAVDRRELGHWVVETSADEDGWVALTESRYPGWTAFVDGVRAEIVPYLDDFMAVAVPGGNHRVEWRYRPPRFTMLLAVASAGILALVLLLVRR